MPCRLREWFRDLRRSRKLTPEMEANRCAISARDCDEAKEYLEAYVELKQKDDDSGTSEFFTHQEGLLVAAIVSYSRAFTDSRAVQHATSKVKVNLGKVFDNDTSKIRLHKRILNKRHKAVAHSDWEYRNTKLLGATKDNGVSRKHSVVDYREGVDIEMFRKIAETMCNHFRHEMYDRDVVSANN